MLEKDWIKLIYKSDTNLICFVKKSQIENLLNKKILNWHTMILVKLQVLPDKECGLVNVPVYWLAKNFDNAYLNACIDKAYEKYTINFDRLKRNNRTIDELFETELSDEDRWKELAKFVNFLNHKYSYTYMDAYEKPHSRLPAKIEDDFNNFLPDFGYFFFKNPINSSCNYDILKLKFDPLANLSDSFRFKLYILFKAAGLENEDNILDFNKEALSDNAERKSVKAIIYDELSVCSLDNTRTITGNEKYIEKLFTLLFLNANETIKDVILLINFVVKLDQHLNNIFVAQVKGKYRYYSNAKSFSISGSSEVHQLNEANDFIKFALILHLVLKQKDLNIGDKALTYVAENQIDSPNEENFDEINRIAEKCVNNKVLDINKIFDKNVLTLQEQRFLIDFILPEGEIKNAKKDNINKIINHLNMMSLMLNEINLTYFLSYSQPPRDRIKELLLIGYIYFRIFKKEMPDLREYCYFNNSSHGRKSDKTFYSIIKRNSKSTKNAMQILTVRRIFQVYQTLFSNIKKEDPYGLSFAEFIKTQRGSYMVKTCFLQDVLKCIGEEW